MSESVQQPPLSKALDPVAARPARSPLTYPGALLREMRPRQWSKNVLLFGPLLFTLGQYWKPLTPTMWQFFLQSALAFVLFCALSGLVYIVNDLVDVEKDRAHPTKRSRPIASGALPVSVAIAAVVILLLLVVPASFLLNSLFGLVAVTYLLLQFAYSFLLKNIVLVDVFALASGFVLRAVAGAAALHVPISPWLYVVTILAALFIGFGKRRHELVLLEAGAAAHRVSLRDYSLELLDQIIAVTIASTVMAYSLYTFSAENLPKNNAMMLTIPYVLYGLFRYLYLVHIKHQGGSPEEILLRDKPTLAAAGLWGLTVGIILLWFAHA